VWRNGRMVETGPETRNGFPAEALRDRFTQHRIPWYVAYVGQPEWGPGVFESLVVAVPRDLPAESLPGFLTQVVQSSQGWRETWGDRSGVRVVLLSWHSLEDGYRSHFRSLVQRVEILLGLLEPGNVVGLAQKVLGEENENRVYVFQRSAYQPLLDQLRETLTRIREVSRESG
jgi:hypothetical protein